MTLAQIVLGGPVGVLTSDESQALTEYVAGASGAQAFIKRWAAWT